MDYDKILEVYTLSEIIEYNDISESLVLQEAVESGLLKLPEPRPLDFDD